MRTVKETKELLPVYESRPPQWLPKTHPVADLGYPCFHPPRPGQDEDLLSATNITKGFILNHAIPAETFGAQNDVNINDGTLSKLESLMNQVFARRTELSPSVPPWSFRMPSRVTLNDAKRQAWFADLANPEVPLQKLGKSVPHGAKGHDLLDLLQTNNVAIPRAVWFLRVFGANEIAGLRNKPSYNPTQYSIEWANIVTGYLKKQLADIALPSAPRLGFNIKQTFKGVLADSDTRERWISRFVYSLKLLRTFYAEGLVDNRTFLTWIVQQMVTCNLAQAAFVARLADEYLDGMLGSRALVRPFAEACISKFSEMRSNSAQDHLLVLDDLLRSLIQRMCLALPDAFVSPRTWATHSDLLRDILIGNNNGVPANPFHDQNLHMIQQTLLDHYYDIKRRNDAMLFRDLPQTLASLSSAVTDVQLLNSITSTTDMEALSYFSPSLADDSSFADKLDTLLRWAVTILRHEDHRPFAAATILRLWRNKAQRQAARHDLSPPDLCIQDSLFDWLDYSEVAGDPGNIHAVATLLDQLVQHDIFSYAKYIQRLIARGEQGLSFAESPGSRHRDILRCIPLHKPTSQLVNQRKVTLHGARARETPEDANEREMRKEIRSVLPGLFGGTGVTIHDSTTLLIQCPFLSSASRYEQVRTIRRWLLPILQKHISSGTPTGPDLLQLYCVTVELLAHARCFDIILDLSLFILESPDSLSVEPLTALIDTIHRYLTIWTCMQSSRAVANALYAAHQAWRTRGVQSRALMTLLLEVDHGHFLDAAARAQLAADVSAFSHACLPVTEHPDPVPPALHEILLLAEDPNPEAPSMLANNLWYKYRTVPTWAWTVWDNTVASLRQVPVMTSDMASREACALRYGNFLLHIDQHLPNGLDGHILQWFLGTGKNEMAALHADAWDVLIVVLTFLVKRGAVMTTSILEGLTYPAWQLGSAVTLGQPMNFDVFLIAANRLTRQLLFILDDTKMEPRAFDILDEQRLCTRWQDVFQEPHFSLLANHIPTLVLLENNEAIPEVLRASCNSLRRALCRKPEFRTGVNRNLTAVRKSFEEALQAVEGDQQKVDCIVDAFRWIWRNDVSDDLPSADFCSWFDWSEISTLLSPWRLPATAAQLQFILWQLDRAIDKEETSALATSQMDKMFTAIFQNDLSSEEAYCLAEIVKGVENRVTARFISSGFRCLGDILNGSIEDCGALARCIGRASGLLRLLAHLAEALRDEPLSLPTLDVAIQDMFITAIDAKFVAVDSMLSNLQHGEQAVQQQASGAATFLARLLQFFLGFPNVWSSCTKSISPKLSSTLFHLVLLHAAGDTLDLVAYPILIDTLYFLLDETPVEQRNISFDPFRNYNAISHFELPPDLSSEYRMQLRALLPFAASNKTVYNLVSAQPDGSGKFIHKSPVLNRPWEWIENLGDLPVLDAKEDEKGRDDKARLGMRYMVRNTASLSLETFAARITGDGVIHNVAPCDDPTADANIRTFEDGLSAESIFERDWRQSRMAVGHETSAGASRPKGESDESDPLQMTIRRTPTSRQPSPILSGRSGAPASSLRQSPGSATIGKEVLVPDAGANAHITASTMPEKVHKRKADSGDEITAIENPGFALGRSAKKAKHKSSAARTKKR